MYPSLQPNDPQLTRAFNNCPLPIEHAEIYLEPAIDGTLHHNPDADHATVLLAADIDDPAYDPIYDQFLATADNTNPTLRLDELVAAGHCTDLRDELNAAISRNHQQLSELARKFVNDDVREWGRTAYFPTIAKADGTITMTGGETW